MYLLQREGISFRNSCPEYDHETCEVSVIARRTRTLPSYQEGNCCMTSSFLAIKFSTPLNSSIKIDRIRATHLSKMEKFTLSSPPPPHVLIFPFPAQGHVNAMLKLAELLGLAGLNVTFLNSEYNHERLVLFTDIQARFAEYPGFRFRTIWDGLPGDHPRSGDRFMEMFESVKMIAKPIFREMLISIRPPLNCIIGDGIMGSVVDVVANELQIPIIHFRTIGASCFWAYFSLLHVIDDKELPIIGTCLLLLLLLVIPTFSRNRELSDV